MSPLERWERRSARSQVNRKVSALAWSRQNHRALRPQGHASTAPGREVMQWRGRHPAVLHGYQGRWPLRRLARLRRCTSHDRPHWSPAGCCSLPQGIEMYTLPPVEAGSDEAWKLREGGDVMNVRRGEDKRPNEAESQSEENIVPFSGLESVFRWP